VTLLSMAHTRHHKRRLAALALTGAFLVGMTGTALAHGGPGGPGGRGGGAHGTVASVGASSFTVSKPGTTATTTITVKVTSATTYTAVADGTVASATVGKYVTAQGTRGTDGKLTALHLHVISPAPTGTQPASSATGKVLAGTVTANDGTTITVDTTSGSQSIVTTSATKVITTSAASYSAVDTGDTVRVDGGRESDGSVLASKVVLDSSTKPTGSAKASGGAGHAFGGGRGGPRGGRH
jgi:hypothetical protein